MRLTDSCKWLKALTDELVFAGLGLDSVGQGPRAAPDTIRALCPKYIYGYLNRVSSSRRLDRESQRNAELMRLTVRLTPQFKTIAKFRRDNGPAVGNACRHFIELRSGLKLLTGEMVAIDGSKFKAVKSRDRNYTVAKLDNCQQQI